MTEPQPQKQFFSTPDGMEHAWYELGNADAPGPAIILQHGFSATTIHEWVEPGIARAIAALGRRVIGLDALGHGASTRSHDPAHYQGERMSEDVSALVSHLAIEAFDYLGYSMGGVIGLRLAVGEKRLRRLVVSGIGEGAVVCGGVDTRALDPKVLAEGLRADNASAFPDRVRAFRAGIDQRGNDRLALAASAEAIARTPIALDRIMAPTLLIAGMSDPLAVYPQRLAAAIADCRLVLVPGDHVSARLSPHFTQAVLDFLG